MTSDFKDANARFQIEQGRLAEGICPNGCGRMALVDSRTRSCDKCGQWEMLWHPADSYMLIDGFTQYSDQVRTV